MNIGFFADYSLKTEFPENFKIISKHNDQLKVDLVVAFGVVLKQKREALKLSQEELSFEAGLHRTYISLLERGLKSPTIDVIFRLSSALNILPSHFIAEVEKLINTTSS